MAATSAGKEANKGLLDWKRTLQEEGLTPIITLLESAHFQDANSCERRWTRHFQRQGCDLLNVRNLVLADSGFGFDLWELNDIADRHNLDPRCVAIGADTPGATTAGFLAGTHLATKKVAEAIAKFLYSLPPQRIIEGAISPIHACAPYFLNERTKALYTK